MTAAIEIIIFILQKVGYGFNNPLDGVVNLFFAGFDDNVGLRIIGVFFTDVFSSLFSDVRRCLLETDGVCGRPCGDRGRRRRL